MKILMLLAGLLILLPETGLTWWFINWSQPGIYHYRHGGFYQRYHQCYIREVCRHRHHRLYCWNERICQ
jgi:hypothetical protein